MTTDIASRYVVYNSTPEGTPRVVVANTETGAIEYRAEVGLGYEAQIADCELWAINRRFIDRILA